MIRTPSPLLLTALWALSMPSTARADPLESLLPIVQAKLPDWTRERWRAEAATGPGIPLPPNMRVGFSFGPVSGDMGPAVLAGVAFGFVWRVKPWLAWEFRPAIEFGAMLAVTLSPAFRVHAVAPLSEADSPRGYFRLAPFVSLSPTLNAYIASTGTSGFTLAPRAGLGVSVILGVYELSVEAFHQWTEIPDLPARGLLFHLTLPDLLSAPISE